MDYLWIRYIHIVGVVLVLGTGMGSAFYLFRANLSRDLASIRFATRNAVLADWVFTLPGVVILPLSGLWMIHQKGFPLTEPWIWGSILLFLLAGLAWLPAVYLQIRMKNMAEKVAADETELPPGYRRLAFYWFWLGAIAFPAMMAALYLMVFRPGG